MPCPSPSLMHNGTMRKYGHLIPCWDCGESKPRSDYHRSCLLGLCNLCRVCANRRSKEYREKKPDRVKALNKKHAELRRTAPRTYENFPKLITCLNCARKKRREEFHLSLLVRSHRLCKPCHNERTNRNRRMKKGLPPKEPRPTLPDWSSF